MTFAAGLLAALVVLSALVHFEVLRLCDKHLAHLQPHAGRARVLLAMGAAFCSHLAQIALFAGGYWLLFRIGHGSLHGQATTNRAVVFLYFSAETYTSLGFGDLYPVGEMRLVSGIEALTGLLMISWTASFTYLEMSRTWRAPRR